MSFGILTSHSGINLKDQQNRASELEEHMVSKTRSDITTLALQTIIKTIMAGLEKLSINSGCRVSNTVNELAPAHHRIQMEFCYLGKNNCLILFATINLLHQDFLSGQGRARGSLDSFVLVFYCSNTVQYF